MSTHERRSALDEQVAARPDAGRRPTTGETGADQLLQYAAWLYLAGFVLHAADHLRRGLSAITPQVLWAGNLSSVLALVAIGMVLMRHRLGPAAAIVVGFPAALGVSAVHLAPHWSAFSDSLPDGRVDAFTWAAVLIEIVGALAFGAAGLHVLRQRQAGPVEAPA